MNNKLIKVIYPQNARDFNKGTGEGMWAYLDEKDRAAYDNNESGVNCMVIIENNSLDGKLTHGNIAIAELRGKNNPVIIPNSWSDFDMDAINNEQRMYVVECAFASLDGDGNLEDVGSTQPTAIFKTLESAKKAFEERKQWAKDYCIYEETEEDSELPREEWVPLHEIEEKHGAAVPPTNHGEYFVWRTDGDGLCFHIELLALPVCD